MNIAICDNNREVLKNISEIIEDYADSRHIFIEFDTFESYEDIIDTDKYSLFILDYNMADNKDNPNAKVTDETNGLEFARMIQGKHKHKKGIIFVTAYPDFVYDAFEVRAYRFLLKPIKKESLFKTLDDYIEDKHENEKILVKIKNESFVINVDDIYYLEVSNKDTFIYFKDSCLKVHKPISVLETELEPFDFMRIHRSYIINLEKLKSFDMRTVVLDNDEKVFLSQKNIPNFVNII